MGTGLHGAELVNLSRRSFLRSAAALGFGLGAGRVFGAEAPIAKIGVFTDTHVGYKGTFKRLEQGYRLFRAHGVDRIVNLGDIADRYDPPAYVRYVSIRKSVYPERIAETFVWANHDRMRWPGKDDPMHETSFRKVKELLEIPNERYDSFTEAGYTFLVFPQWLDYPRYEKMVADACAANPGRPVFVLDHVPPITPLEGSVLSGDMRRTDVLSKYPQVVSLSGHVHGTLAHEGKIWQGAFTAINFGNLKEQPWPKAPYYVAILELYADRMVVRRHAVDTGEELDAAHPWTVTWPYDGKSAPYRPEARGAAEPKLAFPAGAALVLAPNEDDLEVSFPSCVQAGRVSHYMIEVFVQEDGGWKRVSIRKLGADYGDHPERRAASRTVKIGNGVFKEGEKVRVTVTAVGFFGNTGEPLAAETVIGKVRSWKVLYSGIPGPAKPGAFLQFDVKKAIDLPADLWTVPAGTRCRLVMDLTVEQDANRTICYEFRHPDRLNPPFHRVFLPLGNSSLVHQVEFKCPKKAAEFRFMLSRGGRTKVRFNSFRIEACPDGP